MPVKHAFQSSKSDDADTTLVRPSNWNEAHVNGWDIEPGLKPPASPHADDDEFEVANGTDPTTLGWTWGNQDGTTAVIANGRLLLDGSSSTTREAHGLFKAFPASGDVSAAIRCGGNFIVAHHSIVVAFVYGNLTTQTSLEVMRYGATSTSQRQLQAAGYTNLALASGVNRAALQAHPWSTIYIRLRWNDATNTIFFEWSDMPYNAASWRSIASVVKASRPDYYGIAYSDATTAPTFNVQVWADFFRVNWSGSDYDPTD